MLYSKKENVLLYSRQEIGISAIKPVNIYSGENVIVNSPKISLGDETADESIIKGDTFTTELVNFLANLQTVATHMSKFSESNLGAAAQDMHIAGMYLMNSTARLQNFLSPISGRKGDHLSKISYVK